MLTRALGLMSGTSMDGVDVALIETDGEARVVFGPSGSFAYSDADRAVLRVALQAAVALTDRAARPGALAEAEALITLRHAEAVEHFLAAHGIAAAAIDVIGFHGQTVLHRPEARLTVQIGDGAALARRLGIDVVFDLRAADVAAGGQGAPLVPVYHQALVRAVGLPGHVVIANIGGVSNISSLAPGRDPLAGDTGPGNALIDDLMLERTGLAMDRDGAAAAQGHVNATALAALLDQPFFARPLPKSLDRNAFSRAPVAALSTEDAAATLTAFTAETLAGAIRALPSPAEVIVICGGGARNPTLLRELASRVSARIAVAEAFGWSADAMEAQAFAYLAVRALKGLPITFPTTTGAPHPLTGGVLARSR